MTRLDGAGARTVWPLARGTRIELIGQAGTAHLRTTNGSTPLAQPVVDVRTGTPRWSLPVEWSLLAARPDGGAAARNAAGAVARFNGTGQVLGMSPPMDLTNPVHEFQSWVGNTPGGLKAIAFDFDDATRWDATLTGRGVPSVEPRGRGSRQQNLAQRNPGTGIFVKSHLAFADRFELIRYRHLSVRVVPYNQSRWLYQSPGSDVFGNRYFTFGAGPIGGDTSLGCSGTLVSEVNRGSDVTTPPRDPLELLAYPLYTEDSLIENLLARNRAYGDDLPYACFPENDPGFYNSNSFAAGLLAAAGLPAPRFANRVPALFPGVRKPVPLFKFQ